MHGLVARAHPLLNTSSNEICKIVDLNYRRTGCVATGNESLNIIFEALFQTRGNFRLERASSVLRDVLQPLPEFGI